MAASNALASQHPLFQEITGRAAVLPDVGGKLRVAFQAITAWIIASGRSLLDTPSERQQVERIAVQAVNSIITGAFGPAGAIAIEAIVDPLVVSAIEMALNTLLTPVPPAATITITTPPQGASH